MVNIHLTYASLHFYVFSGEMPPRVWQHVTFSSPSAPESASPFPGIFAARIERWLRVTASWRHGACLTANDFQLGRLVGTCTLTPLSYEYMPNTVISIICVPRCRFSNTFQSQLTENAGRKPWLHLSEACRPSGCSRRTPTTMIYFMHSLRCLQRP